MTSFKLSRRAVLKGLGLAGAGLALPPLEAMIDGRGRFYVQAQTVTAPKKLIIFHWPQGIPMDWAADTFWFPAQVGKNWQLTDGLSPLAAFREDINILSGLNYAEINNGVGSHGHASAVFTGYPVQAWPSDSPNPGARGPSVDQIAADRIAGTSRFRSLVTGLFETDEVYFSWRGALQPTEMIFDPAQLFRDVFGGLDLGSSEQTTRSARIRSVLDAARSDAELLSKKLGASDRQRLDQHLTAIRDLERTLSGQISAACELPAQPANGILSTYNDSNAHEYARTMIDLVTMALRCDLTNVAFISLGRSQNYRTFPQVGVTTDYHYICHGDKPQKGPALTDAQKKDAFKKIAKWHMEQFAYLMTQLKADDGMGSLLDNAAVIATSEFGTGSLHYSWYLPTMVAGKLGGMQTGYNHVYPCNLAESWKEAAFCSSVSGSNVCINNLWQTALQAVGALGPNEKFGDPSLDTKTLDGLWV